MTDTRQNAIDALADVHFQGRVVFRASDAAAIVDAFTEHIRSQPPRAETEHAHTWIEIAGKPHSCECGAAYIAPPTPAPTLKCQWCGDTYGEHGEESAPAARTPCLGRKSGFTATATATVPPPAPKAEGGKVSDARSTYEKHRIVGLPPWDSALPDFRRLIERIFDAGRASLAAELEAVRYQLATEHSANGYQRECRDALEKELAEKDRRIAAWTPVIDLLFSEVGDDRDWFLELRDARDAIPAELRPGGKGE